MMKTVLLSLLVIAMATFNNSPAISDGTWEIIHHVEGSNLNDIFFLDESHGWAVGEYGTVMSTTDGGKEWNVLNRVNSEVPRYHGCHFISEKKGWVVGYNIEEGLLLSTEDGGKNLRKSGKFPGSFFFDVQFISERKGWTVGGSEAGVLIVHTEDGGEKWEIQDASGEGYLRKVLFLNEKKGFAVGGISSSIPLVFRTDDGGLTWTKQTIPARVGSGYDIFFLNTLEGWINLTRSFIKTTDGGDTWQEIPIPQNTYISSLCFKSSEEGCFVGCDQSNPYHSGMILKTTDGCQTFEKLNGFPLLERILFHNDSHWVVGADNTLLHSANGQSWDYRLDKAYAYTDIDFVTKSKGFLLGTPQLICSINGGSAIFYTDDDGDSWDEEMELSREPAWYSSLDFLSESSGWIGGSGIYDVKGKDIQKIDGLYGSFYDIKFITNEDGWALDIGGKLWRTSDGGDTWQEVKLDLGRGFLKEIEVICQNIWIAGGEYDRGGIIFISKNDGQTFSKARFEDSIYGMCFINGDDGWAVGSNGVIFATENGGKSWDDLDSGTKEHLSDVLFLSKDEGWAIGHHGTILHTINGGRSWERQDTGTSVYLNKIIYTGRDYLLVVGEWNTILKYTANTLLQYSDTFGVSETNLQPVMWGNIKNQLYQNYPNPFNPETWIPYQLSEASDVCIDIYDSNGHLVRKLYLGKQEAGVYNDKTHSAYWDGRNDKGELVTSGVYFYILQGDLMQSESRKMILLR